MSLSRRFLVAASASLILSNPFNCQNFLLNGLAIGFASSIDDLLSFFFVTQKRRELVDEVVDLIMNQQEFNVPWQRNRIYGGVLTIVLFVTVVFCEDLIGIFGELRQRIYAISDTIF